MPFTSNLLLGFSFEKFPATKPTFQKSGAILNG